MKNKFTILTLLLSIFSFAQVGIGTTSPSDSAILELTFSPENPQGFLMPRMTTQQRTAISNPAEGLTIYNTELKCLESYNGGRWTNFTNITATDTNNPTTGKIWMDRNLGATQIATSRTDFLAYGSLFQWGRAADGHQLMNWTSASTGSAVNGTTTTLSDDDTPDDALFIIGNSIGDWRSTQNNNLWQGVNGTNNPCPSGYRLPTEAEWEAERLSWATSNAAGAYASTLKLTTPGYRRFNSGEILAIGTTGYYWTSTIFGTNSRYFGLSSASAGIFGHPRSYGFTIRCIKD